MRRYICYLLLVICYLSLACARGTYYYRYEAEIKGLIPSPYVQIALNKYQKIDSVKVTTKDDYQIHAYVPDRMVYFASDRVLARGNSLNNDKIKTYWNGIQIGPHRLKTNDVVLLPVSPNGTITIDKTTYRGGIRIKRFNKTIALANIIDLESYLYGVIGCEMDSRWPHQALAVQAVTSRTYALYRIKTAASKKGKLYDYDMTDDIFSQVYWGETRANHKTYKAVNNTRGIILSYQGKAFNSLFHDTCGGRTESAQQVFEMTPITPLKGRKCGYCYHSPYNRWKVTIPENTVIKKLGFKGVWRIDKIRIVKKGRGGHAISIGIKPRGRREIIMNAQHFRIALDPNNLRSTCFTIIKTSSGFKFTGRGWGHAVGMCQQGVHGMSLKGYTPLEIIEYYFPGSRVVKIY